MFIAAGFWRGNNTFPVHIVMCVAAESHCSAVFQATSGATAFFPPDFSVNREGSVLVRPRTCEYFHLSCVLLQY